MRILIKHIWRNILSNRIRSFLIVFSLALSAAVFYMNINISQDVLESSKVLLQGGTKDYDFLVTGDLEKTELSLPSCEKIRSFYLEPVLADEQEAILLHCDMIPCEKEGLFRMGKTLPESEAPVYPAYIQRAAALHKGYELGDTVTVVTETGVRDYTLMGFLDSLGILDVAEDDMLEIITPLAETDPINAVIAALTRDEELGDAVDELTARYGDLRISALHKTSDRRLNSIRQVMSIILLLVMGVAFYVISTTSTLILNYRIPVLGAFRSFGATKRSTNLILLAESAMYGIIASVPGMILGELARNLVRTQSMGVGISTVKVGNLLLVPLFAVGMNLAISGFSVLRAGRTPVRDLLFQKQSAAAKPSKVWPWVGIAMTAGSVVLAILNREYVFSLLIAELMMGLVGMSLAIGGICGFLSKHLSEPVRKVFGGPAWLGMRNLGVSRINRSTSLLVSTVVAMVVLIYVCVSSIIGFFDVFEKNYPYEIMIRGAVGEKGSYGFLENLTGVDGVVYEYWIYSDIAINGEPIRTCVVMNDGISNGIKAAPGLMENLTDGTCLADRMFAGIHHYSVGDTITIQNEDGEAFPLTVVGLCESNAFNGDRSTLVISRGDYFRYIKVDPSIIGIRTRGNIDTMIARINDAVAAETGGAFRVRSTADYVGDMLGEALTAVRAVSVVPFLTVVLAMFGLVNNQLIAFNQKKMQYAVLYSTAMSRTQLGMTILCELLSSFGVGSVMGVAMSVWLSKIVRDILFVTMAYVELVITPLQLAGAFGMVLLMLVMTAYFPLKRLEKMDIVKEIKYE